MFYDSQEEAIETISHLSTPRSDAMCGRTSAHRCKEASLGSCHGSPSALAVFAHSLKFCLEL